MLNELLEKIIEPKDAAESYYSNVLAESSTSHPSREEAQRDFGKTISTQWRAFIFGV